MRKSHQESTKWEVAIPSGTGQTKVTEGSQSVKRSQVSQTTLLATSIDDEAQASGLGIELELRDTRLSELDLER